VQGHSTDELSVPGHCRNVTSLMSTQACNAASSMIHDGKSKAYSHRAGAGMLGNDPGWTSPHPPPACETRHFGGHLRNALAWPCAARTKAHAGQGIICRPVPGSGEPLRYLGRPPARSFRHHVPLFLHLSCHVFAQHVISECQGSGFKLVNDTHQIALQKEYNPHTPPSIELRRWLYWIPPLPLRTPSDPVTHAVQ